MTHVFPILQSYNEANATHKTHGKIEKIPQHERIII